MGDARDTARTRLAERYRDAETLCDDSVCHECGGNPCESHVLDAILNAPGVDVALDGFLNPQVVIRLPAEPIGGCE